MVLFFVMLGTLVTDMMREGSRMRRMSKEELLHYAYTVEQIRPRFFGSVPTRMAVLIPAIFIYSAVTALYRHHRQKSLPHVGLCWLYGGRGAERRYWGC